MNMTDGLMEDYKSLKEELLSIYNTRIWGTLAYIVITGGILAIKNIKPDGIEYLLLIYLAIPLMIHSIHRERARIRIANYIKCVIEKKIPGLCWENFLVKWRERVINKRLDLYLHITSILGIYLVIVTINLLILLLNYHKNRIIIVFATTGVLVCYWLVSYMFCLFKKDNKCQAEYLGYFEEFEKTKSSSNKKVK